MNKQVELKIYKEFNRGFWVRDSMNQDIFLIPSENKNIEHSNRKNFEIYSKVEWMGVNYEALVLAGRMHEWFVESLFNFLSKSEQPLIKTISLIENFIANNIELSIEVVRGIFAELFFIKTNPSAKIAEENAIYDFILGEKDVDIKSFSKVKKEIEVSLQQMTNSINAEIFAYEVYESNEGLSLLEMYDELKTFPRRYEWIKNSNSNLIHKKFKIDNPKIIPTKELREGMSMPKRAKNATFTFEISNT